MTRCVSCDFKLAEGWCGECADYRCRHCGGKCACQEEESCGLRARVAELEAAVAAQRKLIYWAAKIRGADSVISRPRWSWVGGMFGLGSTRAFQLCRELGLYPDEMIGGGSIECECGSWVGGEDDE